LCTFCVCGQVQAQACSRVQADQFTPQEYPTAVTKLPPRQLQWTSSHAHHGYDMAAATALLYDVETEQFGGRHPSQPCLPVPEVTAPNSRWSSQFDPRSLAVAAAAAADSSGTGQPLQAFQHPTKNYFADGSLEQADDGVVFHPVCGTGRQFADSSSASAAATFATRQSLAAADFSLAYCVQPSNSCGVKGEPDGAPPPASNWHWPLVWQAPLSKSSPGQQTACTATSSPLPYSSTPGYTSSLPAQISPWSTSCQQTTTPTQPPKVTPSTSIGEQNSLLKPFVFFFFFCLLLFSTI